MKRMYVFGVVALILSVLGTGAVHAESPASAVSVSPAVLELALKPGENLQAELTVKNNGQSAMPLSFEVTSLYTESSQKVAPNYDARSWVTTPQKALVFAPGQMRKVQLQISVPESATAGGHYATLSLRSLVLEQPDSDSIVVPEVNVGLFMVVDGEVKESFSVKETHLAPWQVNQNSGIGSSAAISNTGNVHNLVSPEMVVYKGDTEINRIPLGSKVVLPGTTIRFFGEMPALGFGLYKVRVEFVNGSSGQKEYSDFERFIVTPPLIFLAAGALGSLAGGYLIAHRRNLRPAARALFK